MNNTQVINVNEMVMTGIKSMLKDMLILAAENINNNFDELSNMDAEDRKHRIHELFGLDQEMTTSLKARAKKDTTVAKKKEVKVKSIPLCFMNKELPGCKAIRTNGGLYTQCCDKVVGDTHYCKTCTKTLENGTPKNGTIARRMRQYSASVATGTYKLPSGKDVKINYRKVLDDFKSKNEDVDVSNENVRKILRDAGYVMDDTTFECIMMDRRKGKKGKKEPKPDNDDDDTSSVVSDTDDASSVASDNDDTNSVVSDVDSVASDDVDDIDIPEPEPVKTVRFEVPQENLANDEEWKLLGFKKGDTTYRYAYRTDSQYAITRGYEINYVSKTEWYIVGNEPIVVMDTNAKSKSKTPRTMNYSKSTTTGKEVKEFIESRGYDINEINWKNVMLVK